MILTGHQDNAEFALAMRPSEPFVLSGAGKDKSVGKMEDSAGRKAPTSPPGLLIRHAGHRDKVVDFQHLNGMN